MRSWQSKFARNGRNGSIRPEVTGQFTRPELERMLLRTWLRDGEVFIQLVRGSVAGLNHSTKIAFSLEALEPDFVLMNTLDTSNVIQGIEINAWRRPVSYRVYMDNPQENNRTYGRVKSVPAEKYVAPCV